MLTPQEITSKRFEKAVFNGYYPPDVDDFFETLTTDYTALYKENAILKSKIKVLVEKVEEYRTTEDAMRMALLTAQRLGDEITTEAKKKSDEMLTQTETDIRDRLNEIKSKYAEEDARLRSVKEETRKFVSISQEIIRQHTLFLSKIEELNKQETETAAAVSEPVAAPEPEPMPVIVDPIDETAKQIDDALFKLTDVEDDPFAGLYSEAGDGTKKAARPEEDGDEPASPRPKFDFNNLKFGANYSGD